MIRVFIADDHAVVREGLKRIIAETPDLSVACEAVSGPDLMSKIRVNAWDLLLLDISMPGGAGLELLRQVRSDFPRLPVLVLSMHPEEHYAVRSLRAGASGYLTKESAPDQLVAAIRKVSRGGKYVSPSLAEKLVVELGLDSDRPPHEGLSDREFQVLCMIASGKTVKQVSDELALSVKTISTYRTRILEKMKMSSNAELTHYAIRNSLVE
jgi:DNA-binding NarL/FixJ family response regulator